MRKINFFEFPSNLGSKEPRAGVQPGVRNMPAHFRKHGFYDVFAGASVVTAEPPPYSMDMHAGSGVRNAAAIALYARQQRDLLIPSLQESAISIVLGGDCSILIGHCLAARQVGNYGLFYIDGHTDFALPEHSETGGAAGMDLAFITGRGHPILSNIDNLGPYILEKNVCCVGNREYDEAYTNYIKSSEIAYYDLGHINRHGSSSITSDFLERTPSLDGFWIHLDVDVLHNTLMPAVDSPDPGGVSYLQLQQILVPLLSSGKLSGIDITILDPDQDPGGTYARTFIQHFHSYLRLAGLLESN